MKRRVFALLLACVLWVGPMWVLASPASENMDATTADSEWEEIAEAPPSLPDWYPEDPQNFTYFHDDRAPRVVDLADLFSDGAEEEMEIRLTRLREELDRDIVIYTDTSTYGFERKVWAADFYDFNGYGIGPGREGICLFICMDPNDRGWWCCCTGPDTMGLYTEEVANRIDDALYDYLAAGEYAEGVSDWIENIATLYRKGIPFAPQWYPDRNVSFRRFHDAAAPRVVDDAQILTEEERASLMTQAAAISEKYGLDVVLHTASTSYGMPRQQYSDSFYLYNGYGYGENYDGLLLTYFPRSGRCVMTVQGSGANRLTQVNHDRLQEHCENTAGDDGPYAGLSRWLSEVEHMERTGLVPRSWYYWVVMVVVGGLLGAPVGGISLGRAKRKMKTVRSRVDADYYLVPEKMEISRLEDRYLYTTTSRVYHPPSRSSSSGGSSSSGSGSSHSSSYSGSSGSSHSGSGRNF